MALKLILSVDDAMMGADTMLLILLITWY